MGYAVIVTPEGNIVVDPVTGSPKIVDESEPDCSSCTSPLITYCDHPCCQEPWVDGSWEMPATLYAEFLFHIYRKEQDPDLPPGFGWILVEYTYPVTVELNWECTDASPEVCASAEIVNRRPTYGRWVGSGTCNGIPFYVNLVASDILFSSTTPPYQGCKWNLYVYSWGEVTGAEPDYPYGDVCAPRVDAFDYDSPGVPVAFQALDMTFTCKPFSASGTGSVVQVVVNTCSCASNYGGTLSDIAEVVVSE